MAPRNTSLHWAPQWHRNPFAHFGHGSGRLRNTLVHLGCIRRVSGLGHGTSVITRPATSGLWHHRIDQVQNPSNYANNTNLVTTYCPSIHRDVVTSGFQFSTEANYDVFTVYNGPKCRITFHWAR